MDRPLYRPLYRILDEGAPRRVQQGHAGLWFDKFCDKWQVRPQWEMGQNKLKWIVELTKEKVGGSCRENAHRLMRLAQAAGGVRPNLHDGIPLRDWIRAQSSCRKRLCMAPDNGHAFSSGKLGQGIG